MRPRDRLRFVTEYLLREHAIPGRAPEASELGFVSDPGRGRRLAGRRPRVQDPDHASIPREHLFVWKSLTPVQVELALRGERSSGARPTVGRRGENAAAQKGHCGGPHDGRQRSTSTRGSTRRGSDTGRRSDHLGGGLPSGNRCSTSGRWRKGRPTQARRSSLSDGGSSPCARRRRPLAETGPDSRVRVPRSRGVGRVGRRLREPGRCGEVQGCSGAVSLPQVPSRKVPRG